MVKKEIDQKMYSELLKKRMQTDARFWKTDAAVYHAAMVINEFAPLTQAQKEACKQLWKKIQTVSALIVKTSEEVL